VRTNSDLDTAGVKTIQRKKIRMAPCQEACPAKVDVPRYIRYIKQGAFDEALAVNMESIPLPNICGYACFNPCESRCAMNQFGEPIAIRALKRVCAENGRSMLWKKRIVKPAHSGKKVAIVGAGAAGLTMAFLLSSLGHEVTIFDENELPGGTMRYGIPKYRLPLRAVDEDIKNILETAGVRFVPNTKLGKNITVESLRKDFNAVVLATGNPSSKKINIEGIEAEGVLWGLEFLKEVSMERNINIAKDVAVIGGGNVAIDAALTAIRLGAEKVDLFCLEKRQEMPAHEWEISRAEEEGVSIHNSWGPVKILTENARVRGIELQRCISVFDKKGNFNPVFDAETRIIFHAEQVIFAIGQQPEPGFEKFFNLENEGVFITGDLHTGPSSIVHAIADAKEVAKKVDIYLGGQGNIELQLAKPEKEIQIQEVKRINRKRVPITLVPVAERLRGFIPIEERYTIEEAKQEASRCLNCDLRMYEVVVITDNCKACGYCKEVCKMDVFKMADEFNKRGVKPMVPANTNRCVGCLMCFYACPDFAIEIREINHSEVNS